jgi:hypothetical protein
MPCCLAEYVNVAAAALIACNAQINSIFVFDIKRWIKIVIQSAVVAILAYAL